MIEAQSLGTANAPTTRPRDQVDSDGSPHSTWLAAAEQAVSTRAHLSADVRAFLGARPQLRNNFISQLQGGSYMDAVRTHRGTTNNLEGVLVRIPPIVVFLLTQEHFVRWMVATRLK